jgi:MFS-type transporter involved in bile tolerance (Atg22 family)
VIILAPLNPWTLGLVFMLAGVFVAITDTLEDSFCAELVGEEHHGTAFGVLATVNGLGDFLSSSVVGVLWTAFGTTAAFSYSAALFLIGAALVLRADKPK